MSSNQPVKPNLFLEEHYEKAFHPILTLTRLERILLSRIVNQCLLYPTEIYYDPGWITLLVMLNNLYVKLDPNVEALDTYKLSARWIGTWLLELLQRRQQLSASNLLTSLEELIKTRGTILEYLESNSVKQTVNN